MCLSPTNVHGLSGWNWDGDYIVPVPIVPSSRPVVGEPNKGQYEIDVREFLVSDRNALIQKTLREKVEGYIRTLPGGDIQLFRSRLEKSFDYRAHVIASYVADTIKYEYRAGRDPWQFPDETLFLKKGDCEDRAFLIASLLMGAGISPYNIRVALGKARLKRADGSSAEYDHMWVMYKNEDGKWTLLEPLNSARKIEGSISRWKIKQELKKFYALESMTTMEYRPYFLFNDSHLWAVRQHQKDYDFQKIISLRQKWNKFNPKFLGEVHRDILRVALAGVDDHVMQALERYFSRAVFGIVGPIVDDIDRRKYNPLDHFDNAFIKEGWEQVASNVNSFKKDNMQNLENFALAAHALADFYAHSSYAHFAKLVRGSKKQYDYVELCDYQYPAYENSLDYTSKYEFDVTGARFSINQKYWDEKKHPRTEIADHWGGDIISGRYAQIGDTQSGLINLLTEGAAKIPQQYYDRKDFPFHAGVPHHNEIAVDSDQKPGEHKLYKDGDFDRTNRTSYKNQFRWRKNTAIRHIRKIFLDGWNASEAKLVPLPS